MKNKLLSALLVICMTLGAIAIPVTAEKTGTYNKNNIPGVLQMEDYDYGGEGVAYHNNSPGNEGGAYRSDDVDLYSSAQGYTMGANNDEWYLYTVNVGEASIYELTVTYATPQSTAEITIESDGVVGVVSRLSVTGSWTSFEEISIGTMKLDKGTHKIKFIVSRDSYTIDSIKFTDVEDQSTKINYSAKTGPYKNAILPTVIEAEDFDKGYGTGYKSVDDVNAGKEYRKADGIDTYKKDNGYTIKLLENEWVGYTFMVSKDGVYQLRIANEAAGKIDIYIDGQPTISNLTLEPITKFAEIAISNIAFQKGCHNIRLENKTSALNLDYIRFTNSSGEGITADMRIDGTKPKEETAGETHRVYRTIYVSPMGNDADSGSEKNPLKTIEAAKNLIGEISPGMDGDIIVLLYPGTYTLSQTQTFGVEDSGKNGFRVIYRGINPLDPPVISGGEKIGEWEKENDAIWKTKVETDSDIRQLYINGYPAQRARSKYLYKAKGYSYDAEGNEDGLILPTKNFPENFSQPSDLELVWNIEWTNQRQLARDIIQKGSETTILMKQPYFSWARVKEYDGTCPSAERMFYLENARELLDEPGEFYYDKQAKTIYYYPFKQEDLSTAECYVPVLEYLVKVEGEGQESKVENLTFDNLSFRYGTWFAPNETGVCVYQADNIVSGFGEREGRIPAQVQINNAKNVQITNSNFLNLGSGAVSMQNGVESSSVTNSLFKDISAAAVTVGDWRHNVQRDNMEMCENNTVSGNIIRRTSQEFYGSPAISAYYVQGLDIKNNDIKDIPYTGISLGWGWGENVEACRNNSVTGNRIENVLTTLKDGAHIYTMGPMRDSVISRNHLIRSIGDSRGGLYTDQGSGYLTLSENVVEKSKIWMYIWTDSIHDLMIKDNFSDTDNMLDQGVDNTFLNNTVVTNGNWPDKAKEVMTQAGTGRDTRRYELPAWRKGLTEQFAKTMFVSRDGATVEAEDYRGSYKTDGGKVSVYPVIVGKAIGDTVAGDRLSYEVTVPKDQTYEVLLNLSNGFDASQPQPRVKITVDGVVVADGVKIDNTGTWINYQEVNVGSTALSMGLHKIEVTFIDNGFSFDYLKLSSATGGGSDVDYDECAVTKQEDILAFADIEGHWARESILSLTEAGLLKGTDQTHFSPDDALTEKQAMILNTRMLGLEESVSGTDQPISRESFAVLLMKGYYQANGKYPITYDENVFLDFKNISPACLFSVLAARELGLMTGDVDGRFLPNETLTRAEASMVYERLKSLLGRGV